MGIENRKKNKKEQEKQKREKKKKNPGPEMGTPEEEWGLGI
jgi:hypothetical protein